MIKDALTLYPLANMLKVQHPASYNPERLYVLRVILREWLGLDFVSEVADVSSWRITRLEPRTRKTLEISDEFFSIERTKWLSMESIPRAVTTWTVRPSARGVPNRIAVLYGRKFDNGEYVMAGDDTIKLGIDVLGTAFFMLTRYEEAANRRRDNFSRFASNFSIIQSAGLLERPIVNEHLELLWWALTRLWPELVRTSRSYRCLLSCDVDNVNIMGSNPLYALRAIVGRSTRNAVRSSSFANGFKLAGQLWHAWRGAAGADMLDDFDLLMDAAEQCGSKFVFNFLAGPGKSSRDGIYEIGNTGTRRMLRRIIVRGHEIGFHGGYDTFEDAELLQQQFAGLKEVAIDLGCTQSKWGGRQHYLRWEVPVTWQSYEDAQLSYDSSLGYADAVGFRCGTCYEFTAFNLYTRKMLALKERPLIVMECSLTNPAYMGLSLEEASQKLAQVADTCKSFNGDFSFLWHNGQTATAPMRHFFREALQFGSGCRCHAN
jgi:hypothetical protein